MENIINALGEALQKVTTESDVSTADALMHHLETSRFFWIKDLPVSVVNRREKLKDRDVAGYLQEQGLFDDEGNTLPTLERSALTRLYSDVKSAFQTIDLAVASTAADLESLVYFNKRPNDYWKRLKNTENIDAMVGLQYVRNDRCSDRAIAKEIEESINGQWGVESDLRDAMRSKKENSGLREKPFVWVVVKERRGDETVDHVELLLQHYFGDNVVKGTGKSDYYIGYSKTLDAVSLREFYKKA